MTDLALLIIPAAIAAILFLAGWATWAAGRRRGWIEGWDDAYQSQEELDQARELWARHRELTS